MCLAFWAFGCSSGSDSQNGAAGSAASGSSGQGGAGTPSTAAGGGAGTAGVPAGGAGTASAGTAGAAASAGSGGASAGSPGASGGGGLTDTGGSSAAAGSAAAGLGGLENGGSGGGGSSGTDAGGASSACAPEAPLTGGTQYCTNSKGDAGPGYAYERWSSGTGSGCMKVFGVDGEFSASWTEANDFLARAGLKFDSTKKPEQIGTLSGDFAEKQTEVPVQGKTSKIYVAVYGWTLDPLTEYYVIEDYGSFVPGPAASDGSPRTHMGTITVDGGTYDIWSLAVKGKAAITGDNKDFNQYFSVRQVRRQCGHVSISEHFSKWASLGMTLGKLEEAMFLMEAQNNSGTIDMTTATISVKSLSQ